MSIYFVGMSEEVLECLFSSLKSKGFFCQYHDKPAEFVKSLSSLLSSPCVVVIHADDLELALVWSKEIKRYFSPLKVAVVLLVSSVDSLSMDFLSMEQCFLLVDDIFEYPLNVEVVSAKLQGIRSRVLESNALVDQLKELQYRHDQADIERTIVENIFDNYFDNHICRTDNVRFYLSPKSVFHGDVFLSAYGPYGSLYLLVGDVTGHGLPAAVGAIPMYSAFKCMANKGMAVGLIAQELNELLRRLLPDHMMLASTLLEVSSDGTCITLWMGGMPSAILADKHGKIKQLFESNHCALSVLSKEKFDHSVYVCDVENDDRLYLFTDGIEESRNQDSEMFGEDRLHNLFDGLSSNMFERILNTLYDFSGEDDQSDDITLVEVICHPTSENFIQDGQPLHYEHAIEWSLDVTLKPEDYRKSNPVAQIILLLQNAVGVNVHQDFISTILSELYSNALEHGLLCLSSSIKSGDDGFLRYYQLRQERLEQLKEGEIHISVVFYRDEGEFYVRFRVSDSGNGFSIDELPKSDDLTASGRGILIVRELCESLQYFDGGSTVEAVYKTS
ncbi:ATP-binding SpoIIE family protein phosphatase [Marinibactrum halimedae]|uniref:Two-component system sensor histidine kinase/response regulator n=1 Tax=Marinibactrum halimedae TaxID=1444977 RepID=A0AA37WQA3_9GAMM|nr:ATP-binding SpoIIE family protein phosphatase [Marinibactrum halimedae]MCD9460499.1 serine/threonine-protein phosphatase [Marinibactrum halimedae]GLS27861.1 two-component system sensor histidine kinase/response regulator [Marinibactrum halimedae]